MVAIGFYGSRVRVGYGSQGGWDPFGAERRITKSEGNILHELDGAPVLGPVSSVPGGAGKRFAGLGTSISTGHSRPLATGPAIGRQNDSSINESNGSLVFAGDMPVGFRARLMSANIERLLDGARGAAIESREGFGNGSPQLAILISCVGRKLVLNQRVEEEIEEVREVLGGQTPIAGFYSYGELSPFAQGPTRFHNQTMTITTLSEH